MLFKTQLFYDALCYSMIFLASTLNLISQPKVLPKSTINSINKNKELSKVSRLDLNKTRVKINRTEIYQPISKVSVTNEPIKLKDLKTNRAFPEDSIITLPSGKKIKIGDYALQINKIERKLNELGYKSKDISSSSPLKIGRLKYSNITPNDKSRFDQLYKSIGPKLSPQELQQRFISGERVISTTNEKIKPLKEALKNRTYLTNAVNAKKNMKLTGVGKNMKYESLSKMNYKSLSSAQRVQLLQKNPPEIRQFDNEKSLPELSAGNNDQFKVSLLGKFKTSGRVEPLNIDPDELQDDLWEKTNSSFSLSSSIGITSKIFGQPVDLYSISNNFTCPANSTQKLNSSRNVKILGTNILAETDLLEEDYVVMNDSISRSLSNVYELLDFPVGPFNLEIELKLTVNAGTTYGLTASRYGMYGYVRPFAEAIVSLDGGTALSLLDLGPVDIDVAKVGVQGDLVLVNINFPCYFNASLAAYSDWMIVNDMYIGRQVRALDGSMYAYVRYWSYEPTFSNPFRFVEKEVKSYLWDGEPFRTEEATLYEDDRSFAFDKW